MESKEKWFDSYYTIWYLAKLHMFLPFDLAISFIGYYHQNTKGFMYKDTHLSNDSYTAKDEITILINMKLIFKLWQIHKGAMFS